MSITDGGRVLSTPGFPRARDAAAADVS
jgi:hypothetical protein